MTTDEPNRWLAADVDRGKRYDRKWVELAASGESIHGEADFVGRFEPSTVLDAGCGTGRVAIELAHRGVSVTGVDVDSAMISTARTKAPDLRWCHADLVSFSLEERFDVIVAAGNVMIFLAPGTEPAALANLASHLDPDGRFITGFQLDAAYTLTNFDADCEAAGFVLDERWSTWNGDAWTNQSNYAVSVHRLQ